MRITPLDIIQKQFAPGRRGYDADEVQLVMRDNARALLAPAR